MENSGKKIDIFYPSFEFEKKTKAFNKYIWWFVSLISMFTVSLLVLTIFHTFMCYFLNLVSTFIQDNIIVIVLLPAIIYVVLSYQFLQWLISLMTSYKFEDGKIIKGKIQKAHKVNTLDLALITNMMKNIDNSSKVLVSNAALNLNNVANLIRLNTKPEFVKQYFDTEIYIKKVYENPKLVKTTKYSLIYTCDNKKKLVIPKIYEGICDTENKKESSFIGRIFKKSAIVFIIALIIAIVDLSVGYNSNNQYIGNITSTINELELGYSNFGYINESKTRGCTFTKQIGNKNSTVSYSFDKNGNIKDIDIQLYYNSTSKNVENELKYIISTLNADFDSKEVDDFINLVNESIAGNYKYGKLKFLTLGRSSGYVDIHSY